MAAADRTNALPSTMLLSPEEVRKRGLKLRGAYKARDANNREKLETKFRKNYGSSSIDLAEMWYDLCSTTDGPAKLRKREKSEKGFKCFMVAHHFLWTYPKNAEILADNFSMCEKYARGNKLWRWVGKIAALKGRKIVWNDEKYSSPNSAIFIITIDGTDFKIWEPKHPTMPLDKGYFSKKFSHGAVKYEIAIDVYSAKCVWVNGPFRGGFNDKSMYQSGLQAKIPKGKLGIVDGGYSGCKELCIPNPKDPMPLRQMKSRARLRHETFNGRLKFFNCLSQTFRHGINKHKMAFEAVCVTVQYQMDNGSRIYDV